MNQQWHDFLSQRGAEIGEGGQARFPPAAPFPEYALCDLSHLALIRIGGEDAETFLQGQFTNDVRLITDGHWGPGGYCTPKGRMLASFIMFRRDGEYLIQLPQENAEPIRKRLPMFILRSKVKPRDAGDDLVRFGLAGPHAEAMLTEFVSAIPAAPGDCVTADGLTLLRLHGPTDRFEIVGEFAPAAALWERLSVQAAPATAEYWSLLEIRAGFPTIYSATREAFVPQMANLDLIDGVSFNKGCYTGQEVVARMKYLGKLKRRMFRMRVAPETPVPSPGAPLYSASGESSAQGAGTVVEAQRAPDGTTELLAVAEIVRIEADDLRLDGPNGPRLERLDLPYAIPEAP